MSPLTPSLALARRTVRPATAAFSLLALVLSAPSSADDTLAGQVADWRREMPQVTAPEGGPLICEAEEFAGDGWTPKRWGQNYYCATFANAFLSRQAYLEAPATLEQPVTASRQVRVASAGSYLVLARYEAAYRFQTQFRIQVEQSGKVVFDRLYGGRDNIKIWPFREKLKNEVAWSWGAGENVVWEGHDAAVSLQAGVATVKLVAGPQPEPAARRNVDLVMLTRDKQQVAERIEKENYLPLDGMLTQQDDLWLRLRVPAGAGPVTLTAANGTEHSPYWVHMRNWTPLKLECEPGKTTSWVSVGGLLDTLSDGQWTFKAASTGTLRYEVEFALGPAPRSPLRTFASTTEQLGLAYDGATRYSRQIRTQTEILQRLVEQLGPVQGKPPVQTPVYCVTFPQRPDDLAYMQAWKRYHQLMPVTPSSLDRPGKAAAPKGYIDVRSLDTERLQTRLAELEQQGLADKIAVVSLGDEIGLRRPPADDHDGFRNWLKSQRATPADLGVGSLDQAQYAPPGQEASARQQYWSRRYDHQYGVETLRDRTNLIRKQLPQAGVGANFSPHHGFHYLGETHKWVHLFREGGMTMPWSEDYIWQVPVATQQINFLSLDLFRAGIRGKPDAKIHFYVMPHTPGNTTDNWRRQFYGDMAHGMQIVNLFEFRPVQLAYTENHCSDPAMYKAVQKALYELGKFEDIIQAGRVRDAQTALWFSETSDIWKDNEAPFGAAKRCLYAAIKHQQAPLDIVTGRDAREKRLDRYRVIYLADRHVSTEAAQQLAEWVRRGGHLLATCGAGLRNEYDEPNQVMLELLGISGGEKLELAGLPIVFGKQDLPFAEPIGEVTAVAAEGQQDTDGEDTDGEDAEEPHDGPQAVLGARHKLAGAKGEVTHQFSDGSAAVVVTPFGKGRATYCAYLPSLTYFKTALPRLPVDRGATPETLSHFLPTEFHSGAAAVIAGPLDSLTLPVRCSEPLVESSVIGAEQGVLIPLVNWTGQPIKSLRVELDPSLKPRRIEAASGAKLQRSEEDGKLIVTLPLAVADALILR